jgi:hypothetical protein
VRSAGFALVLLVLALPTWAANKITVQKLKDTLLALHEAGKSDAEIAKKLSALELTDELTVAEKKRLMVYAPGPLAREQMDVLEARSSLLIPAQSDLPDTPRPDISTQRAILTKTIFWLKNSTQTPDLTASKTTVRYHNDRAPFEADHLAMGRVIIEQTAIKQTGSHTETVEFEKGVEKAPLAAQSDQAPARQYQQAPKGGPGPVLSIILQQAASVGNLAFLRWELVDDRRVALFSFAVAKEKSLYRVDYCCFPSRDDLERPGRLEVQSRQSFKAIVPFHGAFYIDPETGVIVRLEMQAIFEPSDFVHQEDTRIDYGSVAIGAATYVVPVRSYLLTQFVTNADSSAADYKTENSLYVADYSGYQLARAK